MEKLPRVLRISTGFSGNTGVDNKVRDLIQGLYRTERCEAIRAPVEKPIR
jgi:hypothetical protein